MSGLEDVRGVLLDIDGVLHLGSSVIDGAHEALAALRERADGLALMTNTTTKNRRGILEQLRVLDFDVEPEELLTPATVAAATCAEHGWERVALVVSDALREDLTDIDDAGLARGPLDAVLLGDTGHGYDVGTLNAVFRAIMEGAQLVALGHSRYYARPEGLMLDTGAWSALLEYATGRDAVVVGKPAARFFAAGVAAIGVPADETAIVGDDVESDIGGAIEAGLYGVLVRTGKFRPQLLEATGWRPAAIVDSIADVPELLGWA